MAFDQMQYTNEYKRKNYDRITVLVPKGKAQTMKAFAREKGKSVSSVIIDAVEAQYKLDLSRQDGE